MVLTSFLIQHKITSLLSFISLIFPGWSSISDGEEQSGSCVPVPLLMAHISEKFPWHVYQHPEWCFFTYPTTRLSRADLQRDGSFSSMKRDYKTAIFVDEKARLLKRSGSCLRSQNLCSPFFWSTVVATGIKKLSSRSFKAFRGRLSERILLHCSWPSRRLPNQKLKVFTHLSHIQQANIPISNTSYCCLGKTYQPILKRKTSHHHHHTLK